MIIWGGFLKISLITSINIEINSFIIFSGPEEPEVPIINCFIHKKKSWLNISNTYLKWMIEKLTKKSIEYCIRKNKVISKNFPLNHTLLLRDHPFSSNPSISLHSPTLLLGSKTESIFSPVKGRFLNGQEGWLPFLQFSLNNLF